MGKKQTPVEEVQPLMVGDTVIYKGHELTVHEIDKRGYVTAISLQHRVTTDEPDKVFERVL